MDASLWYVIAVHDYFRAFEAEGRKPAARDVARLGETVRAILDGHVRGTRYGIRVADDGLLAAGEPGVQLTWMDAKVGDWVVTPRTGKPVEIQALWLNALRIAELFTWEYRPIRDRGLSAFADRFWNAAEGCLFDVVDADHVAGRDDGDRAAEPDPRHRRTAVPAAHGTSCAPGGGRRRAAAVDAAGPPHPARGRPRLPRRGTREA